MPGNVGVALPTTVLPKALSSAFSMVLNFASRTSVYKSGEYQLSMLVTNERRSWKQQRKLSHTEADALIAFYLACGGAAGVFWFYDPYESAGEIGSNWDASGVATIGRYAVRFDGPMTQGMPAPGRLTHDFSLLELFAPGPPVVVKSTNGVGKCLYIAGGSAPAGWELPAFVDASWSAPVFGSGTPIAGTDTISDSNTARTSQPVRTLFRFHFTLTGFASSGTLQFSVDDLAEFVYINGVQVASNFATGSYSISVRACVTGDNVLAIQVKDTTPFFLALSFILTVS